jgi:hypothetical protein
MSAASDRAFRIGTQIFAAFLVLQCVWLLLTELSAPSILRLPTDEQAAAAATTVRNDAIWTAWMGAIRGDLWAEAAFTRADLLWASGDRNPAQNAAAQQANAELDRALSYAPHLADAWLFLAGLRLRYQLSQASPAEALKMAYYTGPSERTLIPLRLRLATELESLDDVELQQFVRRDLQLLFAARQEGAIAAAYTGGSAGGKRFIEQAVTELNPAYLGALHNGAAPL